MFALVAGCGARAGAPVRAPEAASAEPPPPRRPDGVVLEPPAALPTVVTLADARGVVALRPALSGDAVHAAVDALTQAWVHGSIEELSGLLAPDAGPLDARARGPGALVEAWRQRLRAHDYRRLEGLELVRPVRIERYAWSDLGEPGAPPRPAGMRPDEVYVRVPLEVTQVAGERYFEGVLVLLLRAEGGRARIVGYGEAP